MDCQKVMPVIQSGVLLRGGLLLCFLITILKLKYIISESARISSYRNQKVLVALRLFNSRNYPLAHQPTYLAGEATMSAAVMSSTMPLNTGNTSSRNDVPPTEVDLNAYPTAQRLVSRCRDFFSEVEDLCVSLRTILVHRSTLM